MEQELHERSNPLSDQQQIESTVPARRDPGLPKRAPIACKRCRRLRVKCVHEGCPPCNGCRKAGSSTANECSFPPKGAKDEDREFRRSRVKDRRDHGSTSSGASPLALVPPQVVASPLTQLIPSSPRQHTNTSCLPPYEELVQGCKILNSSYFQIGFIPKAIFLERLSRDFDSISVFLLLSILSVSARFTPSLIKRYGGTAQATEYFIAKATELVPREMYKPSLERTQAFFLLAIADWGNGNKSRSSMHMGFAVTMAGILCLHREETYNLPPNATASQIIEAEIARRTFWMIESQTNLHSGHSTPFPFALTDITAQLPCSENEFAFGVIPQERAVLPGTEAALAHPSLVSSPSRSLFASLIQSHNLWGQIARRACRNERELEGVAPKPWEEDSEYCQLAGALLKWERELPVRHRWSIHNLRGYKAESLDLSYLATIMVLRLSNIVLRRIYLPDIIAAITGSSESVSGASSAPPRFWEVMSEELFWNVQSLYEQIDAYLPLRSREEGFPPIIVFCAYICGSLASYLWKTPQLCAPLSQSAEMIFHRCLEALTELQHAWPLALRWHEALRKAGVPSLDAGAHLQSRRVVMAERADDTGAMEIETTQMQPVSRSVPLLHGQSRPAFETATIHRHIMNPDVETNQSVSDHNIVERNEFVPIEVPSAVDDLGSLPNDIFEAELTAFLQGEIPDDAWGNWDWQ